MSSHSEAGFPVSTDKSILGDVEDMAVCPIRIQSGAILVWTVHEIRRRLVYVLECLSNNETNDFPRLEKQALEK